MRLCPHRMLTCRVPYGPYAYGPGPMPPCQPPPETANPSSKDNEVKRIRHCVKRDSKDCKGKGGPNFCTNAGEMDCKVRNSRQGLVGMRDHDPHCFANRIWGPMRSYARLVVFVVTALLSVFLV